MFYRSSKKGFHVYMLQANVYENWTLIQQVSTNLCKQDIFYYKRKSSLVSLTWFSYKKYSIETCDSINHKCVSASL